MNISANKLQEMKKAIRDGLLIRRAGGIEEDAIQSDKLGYDWKVFKVNDIIVYKEYIEQENPVGVAENPIVWVEGMTVYPNFYYTHEGIKKVWMNSKSATPSWNDEDFIEI